MSDPLVILPNMEALLSQFLRDQPEIVDLVDDRVYTALPEGVTFPAVRVTQITDRKITTRPLWVAAFVMQVEAFGGSKAQAWTLAATCEGLMAARLVGVHAGGVVAGVDPGGLEDLPDDEYEPARPRFLFTSTVTARPVATVSS